MLTGTLWSVQRCACCGREYLVPRRKTARLPSWASADEETEAPWVLLVEHRDEVFARLATDLAQGGLRVIRAAGVSDVLPAYARYPPGLVVSSLDLPARRGWAAVDKLRLVDRDVCVWGYKARVSARDVALAKLLDAEELCEYRGDVWRLSEVILDCLAGASRGRRVRRA